MGKLDVNIKDKTKDKIVLNLKNKIIIYPILEPLLVEPSINEQHITAQEGYAYGEINVKAVTSSIDSDIKAENIRKDVNILGVLGTLEEAVPPIVQNETLIFSKYASVNEGVLEL